MRQIISFFRSAEVENSNSPNGPQMMFATLRQSFPGTKKSDMVMLASKWKEVSTLMLCEAITLESLMVHLA